MSKVHFFMRLHIICDRDLLCSFLYYIGTVLLLVLHFYGNLVCFIWIPIYELWQLTCCTEKRSTQDTSNHNQYPSRISLNISLPNPIILMYSPVVFVLREPLSACRCSYMSNIYHAYGLNDIYTLYMTFQPSIDVSIASRYDCSLVSHTLWLKHILLYR